MGTTFDGPVGDLLGEDVDEGLFAGASPDEVRAAFTRASHRLDEVWAERRRAYERRFNRLFDDNRQVIRRCEDVLHAAACRGVEDESLLVLYERGREVERGLLSAREEDLRMMCRQESAERELLRSREGFFLKRVETRGETREGKKG